MEDLLDKALDLLDNKLMEKRLHVEIVICGAYAIHLLGIARSEHTLVIDSLIEVTSPDILKTIEEIGNELSINSRWLNDQAASVPIPPGAIERASPIPRWNAIKAFLITREDLIKMKASAFSIRRDHTNKDWEDLLLLKPTKSEIDAAIDFVKKINCPPIGSPKKIIKEFEETINDLKKISK